MKRREFLMSGAALGLMAAARSTVARGATERQPQEGGARIAPPEKGGIPVAVAISEGVTVIDFAGPWEVFQDVMVPERGGDHANQMPFELFTVSQSKDVVVGSGGLRLVPDHTFESAPQPKVIVVPAQAGSKALHAWLRKASEKADLTMSVCTGAFQLARAGLLSGKSATTHHDFTDSLEKQYPDIRVQRGLRFVENGRIATAGGLTSGIDLALRVVERYFGRPAAERTAAYMEYQSRGWMV
jgi:transcriptional regulator GlxA family with amidase domain